MAKAIKLFQNTKIRSHWDEDKEKWYFSVIDIVAVLTENEFQTARKYWNKLSERLKKEGNETVTNCHQLKLRAEDGKMRLTDVADTEQLLRLIQSVPSILLYIKKKFHDKKIKTFIYNHAFYRNYGLKTLR